jgi:hypothetical protein
VHTEISSRRVLTCGKAGKKMAIMTYEGIVENGRIRLADNVRLPDQARVYIIVPDTDVKRVRIVSPRLVHREQARDFRKVVVEGQVDAGL